MTNPASKETLTVYELTAVNFAEDSANKIHSDDVARDYGFAGGLVPGTAVYGYMSHPMVDRFERDWLNSGYMNAKFIKPVYDGDPVRVEAKHAGEGTNEFDIQVFTTDNTLCAVGSAGIRSKQVAAPQASDYPRRPLPPHDRRVEARAESLSAGMPLGTLDFWHEAGEAEAKARDEYLDHLLIYTGSDAVYHPAYLLRQCNFIVAQNVALGPWIHTQSEVENFASQKAGEKMSIRGHIVHAYEKRGHELADFDLAIFDSEDRCIMKVIHTAIVRLKPPE